MHGAILPGISSGVLMVIFGMYEKILNSVLNFFKDIKTHTKFLFPIVLGIGIGIILFGNILRLLFNNYENECKFLFIGLIIGGIPSLIKTANSKKKFKVCNTIYTIITFIITIILIYLENHICSNISQNTNLIYLIFSGFVMSIGVVVPGVSSTVLLMGLGVYDTYLLAVSTLNISILIPMGTGLLIGGYLFLKIIKYCLDNFHTQTYYSIIGFVLGSIVILFPQVEINYKIIVYLLILLLGLIISSIFENN